MKAFRIGQALILCAFVVVLAGCRDEKMVKDKPVTTVEQPGKDVVAMVGDEAIPRADLEAQLQRLPERRRESFRMRTVYYLVDTKVYSSEAKKKGLHEDPEVRKDMEQKTKEILARNFVARSIESKAAPSEEETRKYYDEYNDQFVIPEGIMVQRIQAAKKEDAEAAVQALKNGAPFERVVRKWSTLVRFKKRGEQEWLYRKRIDPELEKIAFEVEAGKISGVIKAGKGYQVLKVIDKSDERLMDFKDAKSKIHFRLLQRKKRELIHNYYEKANIDRNPGEGILVKIGDEVIKEEAIADILAKAKEEKKDEIRRRWIQYFIELTVFSKEAKKLDLQDDPEIARELRTATDEVLAKAFRKRFIADKIRVSDEAIAEEYKAHLDAFKIPLRLRLRLIVVETLKEAEEILEEIKNGAAFSYLARTRSIHPSSEKGGELGWFSKGDKDPALEEAAMSLKKYEVSDIIKTDRGYELIELMGKHEGGVKPLEEVRQRIEMALQSKKMEKERRRYYEKWEVEILEKPEVKQPESATGKEVGD